MKKSALTTATLLGLACALAACGTMTPATTFGATYLGPTVVAASLDGKTVYVANTEGKQIAAVDLASGKVVGSIAMPLAPTGLAISPDGATLYVTCAGPASVVCVVDIVGAKVAASIPVGHTAIAPVVSPDGKVLYVCNRFDNNVAVIDLATKQETAKIPTTREPIAAAITPDGKTLFVANHLPIDRADAYDVAALITVVDTATNQTSSIRLPNGSSSLRGICASPDGKYVYVTHILARYQMPTTQLERGWMNTNALTIIDAVGKQFINTVLLDDVDLGAANPWGVACTPDGASICVTHAGTHELSVIDAAGLYEKLAKIPADEEAAKQATNRGAYASATAADVPNDLAFLVGLRRRIRLHGGGPFTFPPIEESPANSPRGLAIVGSKAYVACYYTDTLVAVDLQPKPQQLLTTIALGAKPELTVQRRGAILFADATICFQHWQSCSSCHPDSRVDALNWDLMNDGLGNPKNVRTMLLVHRTPPSMSSGIRPNAESAVRSGITHIMFAVRPEEDAVAIDEYLKSLTPVPSPHLVNGQLSPAAERGKILFFSEEVNCGKCHPEPLYTDLLIHDVGSRGQYDRRDTFDTPALIECWRTAPYMHDGQYTTMKELFTRGKHGKKGGDIESLNEEQLNDLIEFVLSL